MARELVRNDERGTPEVTRAGRELTPPVDIYENDQELLLVADLPGVQADGLEVKLDPPLLRIEGRRTRDGGEVTLAREFRITDAVDAGGISAELGNGVLKVHLKKSQALRPRKVEVRAN